MNIFSPRSEAARVNMQIYKEQLSDQSFLDINTLLFTTTKFPSVPLKSNTKFKKENRQKTNLMLFNCLFSMSLSCLACLQKNFRERLLSIQLFFLNRHCGLIVSLRG